MRLRDASAWIAAVVLALGAEGSAAAQSAPGRSVRVEQASKTAAGGEAPARPAGAGLVLPSSGAPILVNAGGTGKLQALHADGNGATPAAGQASAVAPRADAQSSASPGAQGPRPEDVIRAQINPAARACFENDPASKSTPLARLVAVLKVTPAGEVDSVIVANSYGLRPVVANCIASAAHAAKFAPPGPGGAVVRAEFTFPWREEKPPAPAPSPATPARSGAGRQVTAPSS